MLVGKITSEKKFSHEIYGESFFNFDLEIPRLSGISDIIPITISERLIANFDLSLGKQVVIEGQFRSYNTYEDSKSRLILTVFVKEIREKGEDEEIKVPNEVQLVGHICRKPIYRKTPFGREIADILVAVNRAYNKSDYIPCITWGRNARFCENMQIGTELRLVGRVQSRPYEKKHEDGTVEQRTAYEVSISSLEFVNKEDEPNNIEETATTEEAM
jgi:primosomal replication protein N